MKTIVARYGLAGDVEWAQLDTSRNPNPKVCLALTRRDARAATLHRSDATLDKR
jgi:hypothetical protein